MYFLYDKTGNNVNKFDKNDRTKINYVIQFLENIIKLT